MIYDAEPRSKNLIEKLRRSKKIIVTGIAGSGKSTLACKMASILGIKAFHLDSIIWNAGWTKRPLREWTEDMKEIMKKESWIIEGIAKLDSRKIAYDIQLPMADTIIFLDFPKYLCLWRVCKRTLQCWTKKHKHRVELSPEYPERFRDSLALMKRAWKNFEQERFSIVKELDEYSKIYGKEIMVMRSKSEVEEFLEDIELMSESARKG